jgi:hypothetical protein
MEVITMTVVAILTAVGVVALVYVGLFFVVMGFLLPCLPLTQRGQLPGVVSIQGTGESSFGLALTAD